MSSGHYCDGCAQAYYKCVCNKPQEKVKEQTIKMNERIKELMVELKKTVSTHRGAEVLIGYDEIEKFAELIIRECAESLWTKECYNSDLALEEFEKNSKKIKEHFGVEE